MPLVSVIIPTHNRPEMLREALKSVKEQSFTNYEIIVVSSNEDCKGRALSSVVSWEYGAKWFSIDHGHVSLARNTGASHAKGKWLAFLDDDDTWHPKKLAWQVACRGGYDLISCNYWEVDLEGNILKIKRPKLSHRWWAPPSCVMIKKSVFDSLGGFSTLVRYGEDNDLWRRVAWNHSICQVPIELVRHQRDKKHQSMVRHGLAMKFYDIVYHVKTHFDTPKHLRHTLPPWWVMLGPIRSILARVTGIHFLIKHTGLKTLERAISNLLKKYRGSYDTVRGNNKVDKP